MSILGTRDPYIAIIMSTILIVVSPYIDTLSLSLSLMLLVLLKCKEKSAISSKLGKLSPAPLQSNLNLLDSSKKAAVTYSSS